MADNTPDPKGGPLPKLPSSGTTGKLPSPTTQLPIKKGGAGKIVVMLSSVAKPPPAGTQTLPEVAPLSDSPQKLPPPLPPTQVSPGDSPPSQPRSSATTHVKLPPKTSVPRWSSLSGTPIPPPGEKESPVSRATPPALPAKESEPIRSEPRKPGAQHIPPIKLNAPSSEENDSGESIFPPADQSKPGPKPEGWKSLEPGELHPPEKNLQSLEIFERSQPMKDQAAPLVAPPLRPPSRVETPASAKVAMPQLHPPPLPPPLAKPAESSPIQVAPPMLEKVSELPPEKLLPPHLPADARRGETSPDLAESSGVHKVPALIQPEAPSTGQPPILPATPLLPPASPVAKVPGNWMKTTTPLVLSSSSPKVQAPKIVEAKPALKPAVLPKRSFLSPQEAEATEATEKLDTTAWAAQPPGTETPSSGEKEKFAAAVLPAQPLPDISVALKAKGPLPLTRAARAKKRRFLETVVFWAVLVPVTVFVLFVGSLHFGRDTRVEGQVIPPPGMTVNNEVWIVTDFSSLASGISEDLAAERMPLMQEIQERQDHVQRAQADVAAREERIRLIQEEIKAAKEEIISVVKESRDATQQIWDGEGAQIDEEYTGRLNQLQKTIADRAKSLNLKYQPDNSYQSPEVWANAYRLALYEIPAGVDGVKEHQWLSDQMKQWRDFLKTLDDRKEQMREKAAQLKLAPAPKITDLNTKIDELQQRSDGAAAEEVPLKAELQQAQADLAAAQTSEAGLDDKYYKQLDTLPGEAVTKHIPLATNGRFTWVDDDVFAEGEKERHYWIFARATRADGRQYWALGHFSFEKNHKLCLLIEPDGFVSTKAILRPNLSPEEQEQ